MFIIRLMGGLGNQMFQYAAVRSLSAKYGMELFLDVSFLERNRHSRNGFTARNFELDIFNIPAEKLKPAIVDTILKRNQIDCLLSFNEKPVSYDPTFNKIQPFTYLNGYFQSYKYFENNSEILKVDFLFSHIGLINEKKEIIKRITDCNSVGIHIRRGDYIGPDGASNFHAICSLEYYKRAMDVIISKCGTTSFFIFSDDLEWAKANLKYPLAPIYFVTENNEPNWIDMYLMSICKHNIIANSTFSWWSAWLNSNPDKIVITPKKWFQQNRDGIKLIDLCPEKWVRL